MSPLLKNILAVIVGLVVGGLVNMGLILLSPYIIPPPEGVNVVSSEELAASMHLFEAKNFILPFLAHALGTLVGAIVAVKIGARNHLLLGLVVGAFFLIGGILGVIQLPAPLWFEALDLIVAYIPMGWLGYVLGRSKN